MKKLLLRFIVLIAAVVAMPSCQEEDEDDVIASFVDDTGTVGEDIPSRSLSKDGLIIWKIDTVYVRSVSVTTGEERRVPHRTLRIKNSDGSVMQEWLLDYLHCAYFSTFYSLPGDDEGSKYGFFYNWYDCFSAISQAEIDWLMEDKRGNKLKDFHIPILSDITRYNSLFPNKVKAADKLELHMNANGPVGRLVAQCNEDKDVFFSHPFSLAMWYYVPPSTLPHYDCGVSVIWPRKGNEYKDITLISCNNPDEVLRVRFVRDLQKW